MNKNVTPIILVILAIGIYFTFTKGKIDELNMIKQVNQGYEQALTNSGKLIKVRDKVLASYNSISAEDRDRLGKMIPNNVDNVRLIIDVNGIATRHGLILRGIKTSAVDTAKSSSASTANTKTVSNTPSSGTNATLDTVTLSFGVSTDYQTFIDFLKDLEASLRIMDISKVTLNANDSGIYDYSVEIKTYWLRQ